MRLVDQIIELHQRLALTEVPHAFGGALALAWCTERARGTIDIDVNLFVPPEQFSRVIAALPTDINPTPRQLTDIERDGQTRLWWDTTPVDVFCNTTPFHENAANRVRWEQFAGVDVPFLSCTDLAVFKAFFNRTRDWADLEDMAAAGTLDRERVVGTLVSYLGPDDERIRRVLAL